MKVFVIRLLIDQIHQFNNQVTGKHLETRCKDEKEQLPPPRLSLWTHPTDDDHFSTLLLWQRQRALETERKRALGACGGAGERGAGAPCKALGYQTH